MVNIMNSLYTSVSGLKANQAGMTVVSNNIANMNTEGYSKQRVDLQSVSSRAGSQSQLMQVQAGGVTIDKVTRYQDEILNGFILQENSSYGYDTQMSSNLSSIESYMNEIDSSGLTGAFKDYFSAAQSLADDPTNKVTRSNFVYQAENVANEFNAKYKELSDYRTSLVGDGISSTSADNSQLSKQTDDINNKLTQITELNRQIAVFSNQQNVQPNSLLDKRQLLLNDLAKEIPVSVRNNGASIDLYLGNVQLTEDSKQLASFETIPGGAANVGNPGVVSIVDKTDSTKVLVPDYQSNFSSTQGSLKAMLDAGGSVENSIYNVMQKLDTLAQVFATSVNAIQLKADAGPPTQASLKLNSTTNTLEPATQNIFLNSPATNATYNGTLITAANIAINSVVKNDPSEVATAYGEVSAGAAVKPNAIGNNNNALDFLNMRQKNVTSDGQTVENGLYLIASQVGNNSALMKSQLETQQNSLNQLNDKKSSLTGVSLDEELVDLLKYQKAYQASAKVFSTVSQMMDVIVSMVK